MALIFTESWRPYTASADLSKRWTNTGSAFVWNATGGPDGGPYVSCAPGAGSNILYPTNTGEGGGTGGLPLNTGLIIWGQWMKFNTTPSATVPVSGGLINNVTAFNNFFRLRSTGVIDILGASNGAANGNTNICDNLWHFVEYRYALGNVNANFTLYLDGNSQAEIPSGNALNFWLGNTLNGPMLSQNNNGMTVNFGPFFIYYDSGNSPKSSDFPIGPKIISLIQPDGDSAVTFTPNSGGTNFTQVDDLPMDGDSTYVETATAGNQDLYTYTTLGFTPTSITGCMITTLSKNPGLSTQNMQAVCKNGSTTTTGGTQAITINNYQAYQQGMMLDPNTAAPWTKAGIDSALFGIKNP